MGWRYAARYCNWLTNGKGLEQAAFENGAYDTSTFTDNPDGSFNDQLTHNPDALFWIPTLDEWTKAMHWDPTKNNGEGGYWRYPTSSDTAPIPGAPGTGETNGGTGVFYDVGAYAGVMSPWGLLDGSGGVAEWLEYADLRLLTRGTRGSSWALPTYFDQVDRVLTTGIFAPNGLRIASVIPAPSSMASVLGFWLGNSSATFRA